MCSAHFFCEKTYPQYRIKYLEDRQLIDLGNSYLIEAIKIPAHSEGSVAFLDNNNRLLFPEDEILNE